MGYSLSWAALKGGTLDMICDATGLLTTNRFEETPESEFVAAALPTFWYLVLWNGFEISDVALQRLSTYGDVVSCHIEDHVMFSAVSGWRNGKRLWHVEHYGGDKGLLHLETQGNLPNEFGPVREKLLGQQDSSGAERGDVDYVYEIPAELAKALTGFRHDEDLPGMDTRPYEILEPPEGWKQTVAFNRAWSRMLRKERDAAF